MNGYTPGHGENMRDGWAYCFDDGPEYLHDMEGQRATFKKYQSYPGNSVEGAGVLVMGQFDPETGTMLYGSAFNEEQPAQLIQIYTPIDADLIGGGTEYNGFAMQPLITGSEA